MEEYQKNGLEKCRSIVSVSPNTSVKITARAVETLCSFLVLTFWKYVKYDFYGRILLK